MVESKIIKVKEVIAKNLPTIDTYKQLLLTLFEKDNKRAIVQNWQHTWMTDLRAQNHSYEDIAKLTGLSISSVRYYLVAGEKEKMKSANEKARAKMKINPTAWKAYQDYQRNYQRMLAKKKKTDNIPVPVPS